MPGLEDFDDRDRSLLQRGKDGLVITDSEGLFALNTKMRARNAGYARAQLKVQADAAVAKAAKAKAVPPAKAVPAKAKAPEALAKVHPRVKAVIPAWPLRPDAP